MDIRPNVGMTLGFEFVLRDVFQIGFDPSEDKWCLASRFALLRFQIEIALPHIAS